ncbi:MAG: ABC transporter substrate-binding protein [Thermomicrobiales bacterium]
MASLERRPIPRPVQELIADARTGRISRRAIIGRGVALGLSVPTLGALLASSPHREAAAQEAPLRIGYHADVNFLDPQLVQSDPDLLPSSVIYGRLTSWDATMLDPQADVAESWTQPDDTTYVFTIRPGVTFHTGREVTAEDVVYSYQRAIDTGDRGRGAGELREVESFSATGPMEFTVKLKQPSAVFLPATGHWALAIIDQETVDQIDTAPVGTGPFTFVEWFPEDHATYHKNPDYWNQEVLAAWPEEITSTPVVEALTRIANLQAGQADLASNIPAQLIGDLEGEENIQLIRQPFTASYWTINFNVTKPPFDNVALRQAVARAIDKETINQNVFFGVGEVGCSLIPSAHWAADASVVCEPRDVEAGKVLMAEAGYPDGLKVVFKYGGNSADIEPPLAEILKQNLAEIGIELELQLMEPNIWLQEVFLDKDYEMTQAWYTREPDPDSLMQSVLRQDGGNNVMGYVNERVEELFDQGKALTDEARRKPIYTEIMQIMLEEMPLVKIQTVEVVWAANQRVSGLQLWPKGMPNYLEYQFDPNA